MNESDEWKEAKKKKSIISSKWEKVSEAMKSITFTYPKHLHVFFVWAELGIYLCACACVPIPEDLQYGLQRVVPSPESLLIFALTICFFSHMFPSLMSTGDVWADPQRTAASGSQDGEEGPAPHGSGQAEEGALRSACRAQSQQYLWLTASRE